MIAKDTEVATFCAMILMNLLAISPLCFELQANWFWTTLWASAKCWKFPTGEHHLLYLQGVLPPRWAHHMATVGTVLIHSAIGALTQQTGVWPSLLSCWKAFGQVLHYLAASCHFSPSCNEHKITYFLFSWKNESEGKNHADFFRDKSARPCVWRWLILGIGGGRSASVSVLLGL